MIPDKYKPILESLPILGLIYTQTRDWYYRGVVNRELQRRLRALNRHSPEILRRVYDAFKAEGCTCFIDYGTLLGYVREGGIIKYDLDIDFAIPPGMASPARVLEIAERAGFEYLRGFEWNGVITEIACGYKNVSFDFFFEFVEREGGLPFAHTYYDFHIADTSSTADTSVRIYHEPCSGFETKTIDGIPVLVPTNAEEIISCFYGKDWRIPNKDWSHKNEDRYHKIVPGGAICVKRERVMEMGNKTILSI